MKIKQSFLLIFLVLAQIGFTQIVASKNKFIIENISIEGNSKSNDYVILENLSYAIGDTLSEEEINTGIENLKSLEIFSTVRLQPRAGSEAGKLHLIISVEERYWPHLRFKGGFSELDGWFVTPISLNLDNILGMGNFMDLGLTFGDRVTRLDLNYINPNIFDSDLDFYFNFYAHNQEILHYIEGKKIIQNVPQGGIDLGFKARQGFFKAFKFGISSYTINADSVAKMDGKDFVDFTPDVASYVGQPWKAAAFNVSFNLDKRDQAYYPAKGWWLGARFTQAARQLGSQIKFTRFIFDARAYHTLFAKVVVAGRFKLGVISNEAPFWEKFYLGGPNSLRGFSDRSLSPSGGGDRLYQAGVELRFPITAKHYPQHFLSGVLFLDSGANLPADQKIDLSSLYNSAGFGLRFRLSFLGIVRMDLAYPLDAGESKLQFSLGHTF
jgi:outer membrane protein insertion porin family